MVMVVFVPSLTDRGGQKRVEEVWKKVKINSMQSRCIVKGEAQKSPLFWQFWGGFGFSGVLVLWESRLKTFKFIKITDFDKRPL